MTDNSSETLEIELDRVIEGDQIGSRNYRFMQVGQPVPIKPGTDSQYDSQNPPSQPLAVSERFRLLFVSHSNGFYVARTKEVMTSAEDIKDKGSGRSIEELSIMNVSIGKVSILALSYGDSLLAASVENHLHFFSISALLHKEQEPSFSVYVDDLSCIKDVKWARKAEKDYVVLSNKGKLYHGVGKGSLREVMVNVDAVEWSTKGDFIAVARKNVLSIVSSQFSEKLSISLSSASLIADSIRWVRADSIILGCFEGGDDSEEASYLVQVITTQDREITDASSKPVVLSFSDAFLDYRCEVVAHASGPNLLLSYLDDLELAFIGNRKNLSQHVVLLGWSLDDKQNEAAIIELSNDAWCAHIESQESGDDNLILALYADKVSQNDEIKLTLGEEETEVSPCCILICLTIDGKLSLFHFASAAGVSGSSEVFVDSDGQEDVCPQDLSEHGLSEISSEVREQNLQHVSLGLEFDESIRVAPYRIWGDDVGKGNNLLSASTNNNKPQDESSFRNQEQKPPMSFQSLKGDNEERIFVIKPNQNRDIEESVSGEKPGLKSEQSQLKASHLEGPGIKDRDLCKAEAQGFSEAKHCVDFLSEKVPTDLSKSVSKNLQTYGSLESQEKNVPNNLIPASSSSFGKTSLLRGSDERSSSSTSIIDEKSSAIPDRSTLHSAESLFQSSHSKLTTGPSVQLQSSGQTATTMMGNLGSLPAFGNSQVLLQENFASEKSLMPQLNEENFTTPSQLQWSNYEQKLSKQFCNVEVMAKKMDRLLEGIGGEGGFKDASITSQEGSIIALEEGLCTVSERCRMWRGILEERLREIQLLLDKTVEVLARKIYMKGIIEQGTDNRYWDLWNCQKLSSELELKRQHILEVNQDLTTQLVELERHFNSIEFNKFGRSVVQTNRRTIQSGHGKSRQHSLKSLHNTMGAQLAAAEKLSECLWKQMAALSMESPAKTQNVKRELFETLGLAYDGASYNSPGNKKASDTPRKELLITSYSLTAKEQSRRNQCTPVKSSEPETVRRRRDSLYQNWSSFEPPKTTVERILLQEDCENSSSRKTPVKVEKQHIKLRPPEESAPAHSILSESSATSPFQYKTKIIAEAQVKQSIEHPLIPWADSLTDPEIQVASTKSFPALHQFASTASASLNGRREKCSLPEKSRNSLAARKTSESSSGSDSRYVQQSEIVLHDTPSISKRFPAVSATSVKNSLEIPNLYHKELVPSKSAVKEVKHTSITTESSVSDSNSSYKASVSPAAPLGSSPSFSGKILHTEIATSKSHPGGTMLSSPVMQSISSLTSQVNLSSTTSSSLSKPSAATSSPAISSGKSSSYSQANIDADQKASQSQLLVSSFFTSPSTSSFFTPKKDTTPILKNGSSESQDLGSQPLAAVFGSKGDGNSMNQTMFSNSSLTAGESMKTPALVSQPGHPTGISDLNIGPTVPSTPISESPASWKFENQINIGANSSHVSESAPNAKIEQLWPSGNNSPAAILFSGLSNNVKNGSSAVRNEDEMEEESTELSLGNLGGFGIGSASNSTVVKPNPFGVEMLNKAATPLSSPFTMPTPSGELFRPASFSFQSPLPSQPSQPTDIGVFSSGFSTTGQGPTAGGFGQPAQFGSGQQALGSVLGAFGQSRQLGPSPPGSGIAPPSGFNGGLTGMSTGGFSSVASAGGGFANLATSGGGGGFAAAATAGGGFGAAAMAGTGLTSGGFGAFNNQGGGAFSTFASSPGAGRPPPELFTQMRK